MTTDPGPGDSSETRLLDGAIAFQRDVFPAQPGGLALGQSPHTLFIACADSRVIPELITQSAPGELFVCRNIGNIVPAYGEMLGGVSAVIEYAMHALGVANVVVCGHTGCGAMQALSSPDDPTLAQMPTVSAWLRNAAAARSVVSILHPHLHGAASVQALVEQNVQTQLGHLRTHPAVAARLAQGRLALHGWVYDIADGRVFVLDEATRRFVPAAEALAGVLARATDRAAGHAAPAHDLEAPDADPLPAPASYDLGPDTARPNTASPDSAGTGTGDPDTAGPDPGIAGQDAPR